MPSGSAMNDVEVDFVIENARDFKLGEHLLTDDQLFGGVVFGTLDVQSPHCGLRDLPVNGRI